MLAAKGRTPQFWRTALFACLALAALLIPAAHAQATLFAQGAAARLESRFGSRPLSWILLDATGKPILQHWLDPNKPVPPGSLAKPFTALAWADQHQGAFPQLVCHGAKGRCWLPRGHDRLGLEEALAQSCNDYFLGLANGLDASRARTFVQQFGLAGPAQGATPEAWVGLTPDWQERPETLARAFWQLSQQHDSVAAQVLAGMAASAAHGTARAIDSALAPGAALAKTGTAACTHTPRGPADGFVVVLYPAEAPRLLLLVRAHGKTGAATAAIAAEMLRSLDLAPGAKP